MNVSEIRSQFLSFFESKGHKIVPSAPMVVKNDPTLMFTNAGMNQFKDYILGNATPEFRRIANSQKCLRVSGKHNDLEEVGVDTYHHTMFEMLGNWSFGDYFKEEAIGWAWELLTEVYQIPKDRLYVTVFEGDEEDGTPIDADSLKIWKKYTDETRIILASKKDNFWEMGDTGPCGPCSEIHVDLRSDAERSKIDGASLVNMDHPQVIEIWNNVFMEFNRRSNGSLVPLPEKHVDTGMGLERLAVTLQGKTSNYDIDLFQTLIHKMETLSGKKYGENEPTDIALRVISDHVRAIAFSITDGQLPSNTGAGYVIRRILRRAVRYGYQTLNLKDPFLCELSTTLTEVMGDAFPELKSQKELVYKVIKEEELSFFRTLEQGIKRIEALIQTVKSKNETSISGADAFELYDTYGFPLDLTSLIARENNLTIDEAAFEVELTKQKDRSRAATAIETADWVILKEHTVESFIGYDNVTASIEIVKYRKVIQKQKEFYQLVFDKTPFYPEGGGQVGDKGYIEFDGEKTVIFDTKKENNLIVHFSEKIPSNLMSTFQAVVNIDKRAATTKNHSATHLLHHALRTVLGPHVEQKGSLVSPDYLRFDFSHFSKVTDEQLEEIEKIVIQEIRRNSPLEELRDTPIEKAKEMGAMALFGEKYGNAVRVIKFDKSIELCGGTHVPATGKIGLFKIITETAVAAGIRRIEAITGVTAENFYKERTETLGQITTLLKNPKDIVKAISDLQTKNHDLQKEIEGLQKERAIAVKQELKSKITTVNGNNFLGEIIALDASSIKDILFQLKGEYSHFMGVIGGKNGDNCSLNIIITDDLIQSKELNAGNLIKETATLINGGGGGQAFFATAGGKNVNGLQKAIEVIKSKL